MRTCRIGILNNSLGNVGSVESALAFYDYEVRLLDAPEDFGHVDLIVLAGVGTFPAAVRVLREKGFWEPLDRWVRDLGRPLLGICLGMQLFATEGAEGGTQRGFGWIPGSVRPLQGGQVPHIGWDPVVPRDVPRARELFSGMRYGQFYFMHGYHFVPEDQSAVQAVSPYGEGKLVTCVGRDKLLGVQFHPEKSQGDGLRLLRAAVEVLL